jgi:hypothetical protein
VLALALASPVFAATATLSNEDAPRAREVAETARVKPLIDAEKLRPRIAGIWQIEQTISALMTEQRKLPPMKREYRALYDQRVAARKKGKANDPVDICLPAGIPRLVTMNEPFLVAQTPSKVTFFHQFQHWIRHVYLDGPLKLPADAELFWHGMNSGRWEGDDLVIETAGFNGELWLDQAGLPQSPLMQVTERFHLVDTNTLEDVITIDDAGAYTAPWSTRVRFRRLPENTFLPEFNCAEKLLEFPLREYAPQ